MIESGYHGTSIDAANMIISSGKINKSTGYDEWLGQGVYFFYDLNDAKWWCNIVRQYPKSAIIHADFHFKNKVIDLVMNMEDQYYFSQYCELVKNKSSRLPNGKRRRNYMQLAVEKLLYDSKKASMPIDAIIALFRENRRFWPSQANFIDKFPALMGQVQICIFNLDVIHNLAVVEEEELIG